MWFLLRLAVALLLDLADEDVMVLHPRTSLLLVGIATVLCYLMVKANNEELFLANLGTSLSGVLFLCAAPAATAELVIGILTWG